VIKAMLTLNGFIHKATGGIGKHLESWRRYQHLWKQDKGTSLDKFAAKNPTCVEFEEKLSKYSRVRRRKAPAGRMPGIWKNLLQVFV
jgi:dynein heavy chain